MYESLLRKPPQATKKGGSSLQLKNETLPNSLRQTPQDGELPTQDPKTKNGEDGLNLPKL